MLAWIRALPRSRFFLAVGLGLALCVPLGWLFLNTIMDLSRWPLLVYIYMLVGTAIAFGSFGYLAGQSQDLLYRLLERDPLTVLLNQKAFSRYLETAYQLGVRYNDHVAVIMIDIDDFKAVNDKHNHLVGSDILKQIALELAINTRETDIVARYGGDEFVVGIPRAEDVQAAQTVAERIRSTIESTVFESRGFQVKVTVSMGLVITACHKSLKPDDIVQLADEMLYKAKNNGRNRVETLIHTPESQAIDHISSQSI